MGKQSNFFKKMQMGGVCLGTCVTFSDPAVTEALSHSLDFVWIEMEHSPLSLEAVQGHIMATKSTGAAALVRVAWNDPVLIKPVLDMGAHGVIIPMIRNADEARRAVAACLYPPDGIRGFGPRRPINYGRCGGPEFCRDANKSVIIIPQLEHIDAVRVIDEILAVPGITAILIGPNDLSGSMGLLGQPRHPDVVRAIETIVEKSRAAKIPVGIGIGCDYEDCNQWIQKGMQWVSLGADFILLTQTIDQLTAQLRGQKSAAVQSDVV